MAKHHPDLIFCRKQPGVGEYEKKIFFNEEKLRNRLYVLKR